MYPSPQETPGDAQSELFPTEWLTTEPIRHIITTAPTGVALLKAVRNESGQITDFMYQMANPIQCALTNHPEEDLLKQPLTTLSPDVVEMGMLDRMIQVVTTGQPCHQAEEYRLDGVISRYDQVYLKSNDGVLMLVQDVTYSSLSASEKRQQVAFLAVIQTEHSVADIRSMLVALISGQTR